MESCGYFIEIPRPNSVISTNRRFIRVRPAAPGNRRRSDNRAAIGLVFQRFQDHGGKVELALVFCFDGGHPLKIRMPAGSILIAYLLESYSQGSLCVS